MATKHPAIAKIARPGISRILLRKRLFRSLDRGLKKPFIWISGPPGSGKTTLVVSYLADRTLPHLWYQLDGGDADLATFFHYLTCAAKKGSRPSKKPLPVLTPEHLDRSVFAKRYFEQLCERLRRTPFVIVFDNHQEVPPDSPFHRTIHDGLASIPEGVHVIFISHNDPHPVFARVLAYDRMETVGWDALRLTFDETKGLARQQRKNITRREIEYLYDKTGGWAAGVKLFLEHAREDKSMIPAAETLDPGTVFDFFAEEIFRNTDDRSREVLLKTAFLPRTTAAMAKRLTGIEEAGAILSDLNRRNLFIARYPGPEPFFQYHTLFREFLLAEGRKTFSIELAGRVRREAAAILSEEGLIEDAVPLFLAEQNWPEIAKLLYIHGPVMLRQGRYALIREWLDRVPESVINTNPSLLFWKGASLTTHHPYESRLCFQKAFGLYREQGDRTGMLMSWSGAADILIHEADNLAFVDDWIVVLDDMMRTDPSFPSPEIEARVTLSMFNMLSMRQPHHRDIAKWEEKAWGLMQQVGDSDIGLLGGVYLFIYLVVTGNFAKAAIVRDLLQEKTSVIQASPAVMIALKSASAFHAWLAGSFDRALNIISEALRFSELRGIHMWDHLLLGDAAAASLSSGDLDGAEKLLKKIMLGKARRADVGYYHYLSAWMALLQDDCNTALEYLTLNDPVARALGVPFGESINLVMMSHVYFERGDVEKAQECLSAGYEIARRMNSSLVLFMAELTEAHMLIPGTPGSRTPADTKQRGFEVLREALALGRVSGFVNAPGWRPKVMTGLCLAALQEGIEVEYVQGLIRKRGLAPEHPPLNVENWPWALKIHTLGRFELRVNGKALTFQGKVQKKPLDLLKALLALGGTDVLEEQLTDALWPDAPGDAAHSAFSTTLQRLRQLIGNDKVLQLTEGKLSLDPRYCWTDVWSFERAVQDSEAALQGAGSEIARQTAEKALSLYRGDFLAGDARPAWTHVPRERLRGKFIRLVSRLAGHWEKEGAWEKSAACCQRGLEVDGLAEEFYQRLMYCYSKLGRRADALAVYDRCRKTLAVQLGVDPSSDTEAIYSALRKSGN